VQLLQLLLLLLNCEVEKSKIRSSAGNLMSDGLLRTLNLSQKELESGLNQPAVLINLLSAAKLS